MCVAVDKFDGIRFMMTICFKQGGDDLLNKDGFPSLPNQWKGKNGLYCVGMGRRGFFGANLEAQSVANDIVSIIP